MIRFKKSGEFDRLRRQLLAKFQNGEGMAPFMARVEDIAKQKLASDSKLQYMPEAAVHRELMQELDRYPLVERAVADAPTLSDPSFAAGIRRSITRILQEDRGGKPAAKDPTTGPSDQDVSATAVESASSAESPDLTKQRNFPMMPAVAGASTTEASELANQPDVPTVPREADNATAPVVVSTQTSEQSGAASDAVPPFPVPQALPNGEKKAAQESGKDDLDADSDMDID